MDSCNFGNEPEVEEAMLQLYNEKQFTDVTLIYNPGNIRFYVHKLILSLFSPVLSDIFNGKSKCDILRIDDVELSALENMISFCYGEPPILTNISRIKETLIIAEKYKIVELCNICLRKIDTIKVDTCNVLTMLEMSLKYGNRNKETECLEIISRNRETVFTSESFTKMKFENVCQIFDKLREMGSLTEMQYMRSAVEWIGCNDTANKPKLLKKVEISKISMEEFVDIIISFPNFFTGIEISECLQTIKAASRQIATRTSLEGETSSESENSAQDKAEISNKTRTVTISICDGSENTKQALVTIKDEVARRGIGFDITGYLKDGIFESLLTQGNGDYTCNNKDVTYDGLYFMLLSLQNKGMSVPPLKYLEILNTAHTFRLQKLLDASFSLLGELIIVHDPAFLDGLLQLGKFQKEVTNVLVSNTKEVILHPNFINCRLELIVVLLSLDKLNLTSESELLLVTIPWLEVRSRLRWVHRFSLLEEIAFENISLSNLEYVLKRFPNFFSDDEINSVFSYKKASNSKNRKSLPKWYSFKTREMIPSQ